MLKPYHKLFERGCLFIPYITCGDPDLKTTEEIVLALTQLGADIIELGVPFSDPVADGPTNQLSALRALKNKVSLRDCCRTVKNLRDQHCVVPIILFTYLNPIVNLGIKEFAALAGASGVSAVLVVDLPAEEAGELKAALGHFKIGIIMLMTPTTSPQRMRIINEQATDFVYYVSRTGVTGVQSQLSTSLEAELLEVRQHTDLPIVVGFGISTPLQVEAVAKFADGVVVGSALVKQLEADDIQAGKTALLSLANEMIKTIKPHKASAS